MKADGFVEVKRNLAAYPQACLTAAYGAFQDGAEHITDWEKANHVWQNQTGQAEALIGCTVVVDGTDQTLRLVNAHGVPYGPRLETIRFGRYAILLTALRTYWFPILAEAGRRMRGDEAKLRGGVSG